MSFEEDKILSGGTLYRYYVEVMETKLSRKIKKGEVIHHIDGNRQNNSPNNLMLFPSKKEHNNFHKKQRMSEGYKYKTSLDCYYEKQQEILDKLLQERIKRDSGTIICNECNRRFKTLKGLSNHRRTYHVKNI